METKRNCLTCACFPVCCRVIIDFQMKQKWNSNNPEVIRQAIERWDGNRDTEEFFSFMSSKCEFFVESKKTAELREVAQRIVSGGP